MFFIATLFLTFSTNDAVMTEGKHHEDQMYIEGLLQNNSVLLQAIYKKFVPKIVYYIRSNSGSEDDAQDVIQEVLITIFHQAKNNGLTLTCPFEAYFFLLCKRRWLNEIKKKSGKQVTIVNDIVSLDASVQDMLSQTETLEDKQLLFDEMFQNLGEKCRELLQLSFTTKTMEEVAAKLNVTYAYVRKKKSLCTGKLTEMIQQSGRYQSLKS